MKDDLDGAAEMPWPLAGDAWPAAPEAADFRAALLARTASMVRRRARWRRGRRVATIGLAYVAGLLTAVCAWRMPTAPPVPRREPAIVADEGGARDPIAAKPRGDAAGQSGRHQLADGPPHRAVSSSRPVPEQRSLDAADGLASLSPAELRRLVPKAPRETQVRLLALAGDRYLLDQADVASALDCYRQVLELTPAGERAPPEPEDSWLLAELKAAAN
jgi:hypothetical protein